MVWEFFIYVYRPFSLKLWMLIMIISQSGYNQLVGLFSNYSAPLFFSEYGCNLVEPRLFTEVGSICIPRILYFY